MYLYVDDLDAEVERLRSNGVHVLREPEAMPWGERIASVVDPDGNPVALCAEKPNPWPSLGAPAQARQPSRAMQLDGPG
jgi:uncharacterized glyoxalase superfamily protein PhnB